MVSPLRDCSILRSWPPANSEIVAHSGTTITQQFSVALTVVSFGRIPPRHVSVGAGPLSRHLDGRQPGGRPRSTNSEARRDGLQPCARATKGKHVRSSGNHRHEAGSMRSDIDIKRDVEAELRWNPDIDATDIAVAVKDGVVTLTGFVRSYGQKTEAEQTAKRVTGVVAVANDIEVRLPIFNRRPDPEIARDSVAAIQNELPYSSDHIRVVVKDGWVTLEGHVEWNYQRQRAEEAVHRLRGVKGITNLIALQPRVAT